MSDERDLEAALRGAHGSTPAGDHLADEELAARAERRAALSAEEQEHLAACLECRTAYAQLLRSAAGAEVVPLRRKLFAAGIAAAATIAAFALLRPGGPSEHRGIKGAPNELRAEVSLLAVGSGGERRDLEEGGTITTSERLGFRYGNPKGAYTKLAILGWDGREVRWYYPEDAAQPAVEIERGPSALGVRLPFDVELADHTPGTLVVAAAFDRDPRALAEALREGRVKTEPGVVVVHLRLEAR